MEDLTRIESRRNAFREQYSSLLFNSYLNALLVVALFTGSLTYSIKNIQWDATSFILIPLFFLYAEAMMYATHRWQQHKNIRYSERIFEMHSLWHHGMFSNAKMHVDSLKDMNMVVLPFFVHGFVIAMIYLPIALVFENFLDTDFGWIFMFAVTLQLVWYEIVHTASHLKSPPLLFIKLATHHQNHHNTKLMGRNNFGIGTTIFDRVFRTYYG